ncbi:RICIN domain-containing protein [Streptomyces cucumeris]|uniref:RICIN domain-containing protein n=1 Tax=Streptomyces cucumeris TaxID=2962890 RepID=UPI003D74D408
MTRQTLSSTRLRLPRIGPSAPGADGSFRIRNEKDGNCIDFTDSDTYNLGPAACDSGSEQQRWYLELTYGTTTLIRDAATDECLDVSGENNADGSEVVACSCKQRSSERELVPRPVERRHGRPPHAVLPEAVRSR